MLLELLNLTQAMELATLVNLVSLARYLAVPIYRQKPAWMVITAIPEVRLSEKTFVKWVMPAKLVSKPSALPLKLQFLEVKVLALAAQLITLALPLEILQ